jgi:murein L,D-transpeptidase YafK
MKALLRLALALLLLSVQAHVQAESPIDLVRVLKSERKLQLLSAGIVIREFQVALGGNPKGHKQQKGDSRTPEGNYILDFKKPDSAFYKSFHISYPNANDIRASKVRGVDPGGAVMVHGQKNGLGGLSFLSQRFDWTDGCVALSNGDMDIMWGLVQPGTKIEILP